MSTEPKAVDKLNDDYAKHMRKYPECVMVLVIDFDGQWENRQKIVKEKIPGDLIDRVFVVGASSNPEKLKVQTGMKNFEDIGRQLARNCTDKSPGLWEHALLKHNKEELRRMHTKIDFLYERSAGSWKTDS